MAFISVSEGLIKKSTTTVENKFITKYLPVLNSDAVKVYLYSLYLCQSGLPYTVEDFAKSINFSVEKVKEIFDFLEEFELISIVSREPYEVKLLEAENVSGTPKKFKPEKYSDFAKTVQSVLSGRMISSNEFMEYFLLLEEYGFEQNALIMIINYCVNLHGNAIRFQYIKKVAKSFAEEGAVTAKKVDEKLSAYTSSTPALIELFKAVGIKKQPDVDDDKLYKKWTATLGFDEKAIAVAAKQFKTRTVEKLDDVLEELFKNRKFDAKEIEDYCKNKNSVYNLAYDIAKSLGVYMQTAAPFVETYVNAWCNRGFSFAILKTVAEYLFRQGNRSFEEMDAFLQKLYDNGVVADRSVNDYIAKRNGEDLLIKELLTACGLSRKITPWDRESLAKWRSWNFSDEMLFEAAKLSCGKANPMAYVNGVLSGWKADGVYSVDKITSTAAKTANNDERATRAQIDRHYYDLRHAAQERAENALNRATADPVYGGVRKKLAELGIELAFAEIRDKNEAAKIAKEMRELETDGDRRLAELGINKSDFVPRYSCEICNDTGYYEGGTPCACMKKYLKSLN